LRKSKEARRKGEPMSEGEEGKEGQERDPGELGEPEGERGVSLHVTAAVDVPSLTPVATGPEAASVTVQSPEKVPGPKRVRRLLKGVNPRHRKAARLLAQGKRTGEVAEVVGFGPAYLSRVVQTPEFRAELDRNLRQIQAQAQRLIAYGLTRRLEAVDPEAAARRLTPGGLPEPPIYTAREVADDALSPALMRAAGVSERVSFDVDTMIERELARIRGERPAE